MSREAIVPLLLSVGALLLSSCADELGPARPQALVFIDTDAPSPRLFDRVRIAVLAEDRSGALVQACPGCNREAVIGASEDWPLSFGVEPPEDGSARFLHVLAFPVGRTGVDGVLSQSAIEHVARIRFPDHVAPQEIILSAACTGIPSSLLDHATCLDGELGDLPNTIPRSPEQVSRVGSYRTEYDRDCAGSPREDSGTFDGEVCIRGGTFWMGDERRQGFGGHVDAIPEHLVTVSPFFMDRHEYTVGRYRDALASGFPPVPIPVAETMVAECTYLDPDSTDNDALPLNCVRFSFAQELCAFEGKRLPTEAEWEWAAGGRGQERLFPWGFEASERVVMGPGPVDSREFDESRDGIRDLGWNVSEWLADVFQIYDEPCWQPGNYGPDPVCAPGPDGPDHGRAARGGFWAAPGDAGGPYRAMVPSRLTISGPGFAPFIGFRCVRDSG